MKIPGKLDLILWGAVGLLAIGAFALVNHWRLDSGRLKVERVQHSAKVNELEQRIAFEIDNQRKANAASDQYQKKLAELDAARADIPVRTVRLCNGPKPVSATAARATPGGPDAASTEGLQEAAGSDTRDRWSDDGPDIGPELYAVADDGDKCSAQVDALQAWIRGR